MIIKQAKVLITIIILIFTQRLSFRYHRDSKINQSELVDSVSKKLS